MTSEVRPNALRNKSYKAYYEARKGYTRELEEIACKDTYYAYRFALYIPGANIEYCQEWACKNPYWAYWFARNITEADLNYCLEACKGTIYYASIQEHIMEEAIG